MEKPTLREMRDAQKTRDYAKNYDTSWTLAAPQTSANRAKAVLAERVKGHAERLALLLSVAEINARMPNQPTPDTLQRLGAKPARQPRSHILSEITIPHPHGGEIETRFHATKDWRAKRTTYA